jgi:hypothetical protein
MINRVENYFRLDVMSSTVSRARSAEASLRARRRNRRSGPGTRPRAGAVGDLAAQRCGTGGSRLGACRALPAQCRRARGGHFATIVAAETAEVAALLARLPDPPQRLALLLDTLLDGARLDVTAVWVEAWTLGRRNEALAASVRVQMDAWQAVLQDVVEAGIAAGQFETPDAASVAWQILGMIDGLNAQALVRWDGVNDRGVHLARAVEGMVGAARGALVPGGLPQA